LNFLAAHTFPGSPHQNTASLLIGDPSSSSAQYPRLQFASQEMNAIASSMGAAQTAILRGDAATPESYTDAKPARFGFIHFAAHAAANPQSPLDSAVILSGPAGKSRLLARDVMAIPLTAQLVTISACRSAGGKAYAGEGLIGFAWAFLRAGARNVIAGLWDVEDRSTAQLMAGLYGQLAAGKDVPDALRAAKLALIHQGGAYAKPFYWAPFQLYAGAAQTTSPPNALKRARP
jgi:CHAT domain-containing protein